MPKLKTVFTGDEVKQFTGVLVECYHHKDDGRGKRLYLGEFNEAERATIGRLYKQAYGWVMRTGHPDEIEMTLATYQLLVRAANFFAAL